MDLFLKLLTHTVVPIKKNKKSWIGILNTEYKLFLYADVITALFDNNAM